MINVYLSFPGNAAEAIQYYAQVFDAPEPFIMKFSDLPEKSQAEIPEGMKDMLMHGNLKTFAGNIMMSDDKPDGTKPNRIFWVAVTHDNKEQIRLVFDRLAKDGEIIMPLEPTFFTPLYGQIKDKYGFYWMLMLPDNLS